MHKTPVACSNARASLNACKTFITSLGEAGSALIAYAVVVGLAYRLLGTGGNHRLVVLKPFIRAMIFSGRSHLCGAPSPIAVDSRSKLAVWRILCLSSK
jgi:hypothetical protein